MGIDRVDWPGPGTSAPDGRKHGEEGARRPGSRWQAAVALLAVGAVACSGAADEGKLPPEIPDPAAQHTPAGAMSRYRGTLALIPLTVDNLSTLTGLLTDELTGMPAPLAVSYSPFTEIDSRRDLSGFSESYGKLQYVRGQAREARGFLQAYAPGSSPALAGHMFAVEAYAELLLAETFCSGIPLSTVDFAGDYTLAAGSTSADVFRHALALLDSAAVIASDSDRIVNFVAVERARTLLALDRYAEAAAAAAAVPDHYQYQMTYGVTYPSASSQGFPIADRLLTRFFQLDNTLPATPTVADSEGGVGLNYLTSGDPRTPVTPMPGDPVGTKYFPSKYPQDGQITLTLADGVEARLIEAEVSLKLQPGTRDWIDRLNALRTDNTFDTQPNAEDPSRTDTLWHAGSGGVGGLRPLDDPQDSKAREDLLFRERGFWLYLTGHRQGDMRRLVRQYGRPLNAVYPSGGYLGGGSVGTYGDEVVPPVPPEEEQLNPKYTGCVDRGA